MKEKKSKSAKAAKEPEEPEESRSVVETKIDAQPYDNALKELLTGDAIKMIPEFVENAAWLSTENVEIDRSKLKADLIFSLLQANNADLLPSAVQGLASVLRDPMSIFTDPKSVLRDLKSVLGDGDFLKSGLEFVMSDIELQAGADPEMLYRVLLYMAALYMRYKRTIICIILYLFRCTTIVPPEIITWPDGTRWEIQVRCLWEFDPQYYVDNDLVSFYILLPGMNNPSVALLGQALARMENFYSRAELVARLKWFRLILRRTDTMSDADKRLIEEDTLMITYKELFEEDPLIQQYLTREVDKAISQFRAEAAQAEAKAAQAEVARLRAEAEVAQLRAKAETKAAQAEAKAAQAEMARLRAEAEAAQLRAEAEAFRVEAKIEALEDAIFNFLKFHFSPVLAMQAQPTVMSIRHEGELKRLHRQLLNAPDERTARVILELPLEQEKSASANSSSEPSGSVSSDPPSRQSVSSSEPAHSASSDEPKKEPHHTSSDASDQQTNLGSSSAP